MHIERAQITLDGDEPYYNAAKNYKSNPDEGFSKAILGIDNLLEAGIQISVRMNYTGDNKDSLLRLISFLCDRYYGCSQIHYYAYPIWSSLGDCGVEQFVSSSEADKGFIEILASLISRQMASPKGLLRLGRKRRQCVSCNINSFAILPDGSLAKCSEAFAHPVGTVWADATEKSLVNLWTTHELDSDCVECVYLPICLGGCRASKCTAMDRCFAFKPVFNDLLILYMDYLTGNLNR